MDPKTLERHDRDAKRRGWKVVSLGAGAWYIATYDGREWSKGKRIFRRRRVAIETARILTGQR